MPKYSKRSSGYLNTCDDRIQRVFNRVIQHFDCKITCGHRTQEQQDLLFNATPSVTQVEWPNSRHNSIPSEAIDVVPYPVDYDDRERFTYFAGFVIATGLSMGIRLRWGGDWDQDTEVSDNSFDDMPHFELVD
jgi:peptidoglycan LD-endopeptidase CwlK